MKCNRRLLILLFAAALLFSNLVFSQQFSYKDSVDITQANSAVEGDDGSIYLSGYYAKSYADTVVAMVWKLDQSGNLLTKKTLKCDAGVVHCGFVREMPNGDRVLMSYLSGDSTYPMFSAIGVLHDNLDWEPSGFVKEKGRVVAVMRSLESVSNKNVLLSVQLDLNSNKWGYKAYELSGNYQPIDSGKFYPIHSEYPELGYNPTTNDGRQVYFVSKIDTGGFSMVEGLMKIDTNLNCDTLMTYPSYLTFEDDYVSSYLGNVVYTPAGLMVSMVTRKANWDPEVGDRDSYVLHRLDTNYKKVEELTFRESIPEEKENGQLAVDFAGNLILAAEDSINAWYSSDGRNRMEIIKLDPQRNLIFEKEVNLGFRIVIHNVVPTKDGGFLVMGGATDVGKTFFHAFVVKFDENGSISGVSGLAPEDPLVNIYPNPASEFLNLKSTKEFESVSIINDQGQQVYGSSVIGQSLTIKTQTWPTGAYFVIAKFKEGFSTKKIVITTRK